jgi:hypothetical protein
MFDLGKSLITMNPDDQKVRLDKAAAAQRDALFKVAEDNGNRDQRQGVEPQQREPYHELDRLNTIVERENEAHDFFGKHLAEWQKGVAGTSPSKESKTLERQFTDYENAVLSEFPVGGKRHTTLAASLPTIRKDFLAQGQRHVLDKLNERSRTVLEQGLRRIARGALKAGTKDAVLGLDDQAFELINQYVLSEADFDAKDASVMYDKYLNYAGFSPSPTASSASGQAAGQTAGPESNPEQMAGREEPDAPATPPADSSAQHAREMEARAWKGNDSGKLAGADNDMRYEKTGGPEHKKEWSPEQTITEARRHIGSEAWKHGRKRGNFGSNAYKCNLFVYEMARNSGAEIPLMHSSKTPFSDERYPPVAADWSNPKTEIKGWVVVDTPKPGDVASDGKHMGIVSGEGTTISASSEAEKVVKNDWGFRKEDEGRMVFRRHLGK